MAVRVPTEFKNEGDKGGKGDRGAAGRDPAAQNGGETKPAGGAAAPGGKGRAEARAAAKLARAEESQGVANILKEEGLLDAEVMQQLDVLVSAPRACCRRRPEPTRGAAGYADGRAGRRGHADVRRPGNPQRR